MPDPLEVVATRIARLALREVLGLGRAGSGPALTVVRDTTNGKISVGLNTGTPSKVAKVLEDSINAQKNRISRSEVIVVRTDPTAAQGGHSEVNALNPAILARERILRRTLTEAELRTFELHNVWLSGDGRKLTTAPRCEHCARITRGVSVTQSVFVAEGGRVGEVSVPQRGAVKRVGMTEPEPVTTASGSIGVRRRGAAREGIVGSAAVGLLTGAMILAEPLIKRWFAEHYLKEQWAAEARDMIVNAITANLWHFNTLIATSITDIQEARAAGRSVTLHVSVDTDWVNTEFGPAQTSAQVTYYSLLYEGDTPIEWPVFQRHNWVVDLFGTRVTTRRQTFDFPL